MKKQFTIIQAASELCISQKAVRSAIRRGVLKTRAKNVTKVVLYIPEDSLDSYREYGLKIKR